MRARRRWRFLSILALAAVAVGAAAYWYLNVRPGEGPAAVGVPAGLPPEDFAIAVEAAPVAVERIERTIPTVGSLRSNESVVISPEIAGRLVEIPVAEGAPVAAGTPIAILDQDVHRAELAQIEASLELSKANYKRAVDLLAKNAGTVRARDEAVAKLRADEAAVALAKARLAKTRILAPFDGVLGLRRMSVGQYLAPGDPIINLESIDPLKVDFRLPEVHFGAVAVGQRIVVRIDAFPGERFMGELYAIDPLIDEEGRAIVLRAHIANRDRRLRPGLFARVELVYETLEDAILVPEQALVPRGDRNFVFRVIDGKAALTEVETGERFGARVEVREGLAAGDVVVTAGQLKLQDGMAVALAPPPEG